MVVFLIVLGAGFGSSAESFIQIQDSVLDFDIRGEAPSQLSFYFPLSFPLLFDSVFWLKGRVILPTPHNKYQLDDRIRRDDEL